MLLPTETGTKQQVHAFVFFNSSWFVASFTLTQSSNLKAQVKCTNAINEMLPETFGMQEDCRKAILPRDFEYYDY